MKPRRVSATIRLVRPLATIFRPILLVALVAGVAASTSAGASTDASGIAAAALNAAQTTPHIKLRAIPGVTITQYKTYPDDAYAPDKSLGGVTWQAFGETPKASGASWSLQLTVFGSKTAATRFATKYGRLPNVVCNRRAKITGLGTLGTGGNGVRCYDASTGWFGSVMIHLGLLDATVGCGAGSDDASVTDRACRTYAADMRAKIRSVRALARAAAF